MSWPPAHPLARREFDEAFDFFAEESQDLARRFLVSTMTTIARVREFPESGSPIRELGRRIVIRPFRYDLIYRVQDDDLYILAIAHHARHPDYWRRRI